MTSGDRLLIAFGAFAGGIALGMLFAPESSPTVRREISLRARQSGRRLGAQVKSTQRSILEAGDEAAVQLRKAAGEAVGKYVPDLAGDDDAWQEVYAKTAKDVEDEKR